ncbi:hypothetical protein IPH92_03660 [Candidatus Kaiserbacteria bacterium]|nr:MAG: hypothetical protein IPH92_03660 [Candidatus Kaiserbacteria bacterium]
MARISAHFLPALEIKDLGWIITTQDNDSGTCPGLIDLVIGHKEIMEKYLRTGNDSLISPRVLEIYSDAAVRRSLRSKYYDGED